MSSCIAVGLLAAALAVAADDPALQPVTVCEVLQDMAAHSGKPVVVLGRFSFRPSGRTLSEMKCGREPATVILDVVFDAKSAPKPAGTLAIDAPVAYKKLALLKTTTPLAKIPFGSPDYDRWAFVYGRVEPVPPPPSTTPPGAPKHGRIVCSEALVVFLGSQQ